MHGPFSVLWIQTVYIHLPLPQLYEYHSSHSTTVPCEYKSLDMVSGEK